MSAASQQGRCIAKDHKLRCFCLMSAAPFRPHSVLPCKLLPPCPGLVLYTAFQNASLFLHAGRCRMWMQYLTSLRGCLLPCMRARRRSAGWTLRRNPGQCPAMPYLPCSAKGGSQGLWFLHESPKSEDAKQSLISASCMHACMTTLHYMHPLLAH